MTQRRSGMSIAEVLVALFIMAIGVMAIMTLFPLGMMQMGQALKDDRTAQCAAQADSFMRSYWKQFVVGNPNATNVTSPGYEPFDAAMNFPDSQWAPTLSPPPTNSPIPLKNNPSGTLPPVFGSVGPSYPVFVDPMGFGSFWSSQNSAAFQFWVGNSFVPRRSIANLNSSPFRICSMMDGLTFDTNGNATPAGAVERDMRYNWLWILQRPDNSQPTTASMTVVVFDRRSFQFAPAGAESAFNPIVNGIAGNAGSTSVSFGVDPGVLKGGWIADLTIGGGTMNANFYRVVSSTPNGLGPSGLGMDIELQQPITDNPPNISPATTSRVFVVFAGVSEVFQRPTLSAE